MSIFSIDNDFKLIDDNILIQLGCPCCHKKGIPVSYDTVLSLSNDFIKTTLQYNKFYLCKNKTCDVAYYSDDRIIKINEIKVPIWFKKKKEKFIVCYCRNITIDDIKIAVSNIEKEITIENVIKYLGKENIPTNCRINMPTGENCNQLFLNAIEYVRKIDKINK